MNLKKLEFGKEGRDALLRGVQLLAKAVKSTLGPMGNTVLIESPEHLKGITVTKDGATVANSVVLSDPIENLAVRMVKEGSSLTADLAGDGTTTCVVLTEGLVETGMALMGDGVNRTETLRELKELSEKVISRLSDWAIDVGGDQIEHIATVSANNDSAIGKLVTEAYERVGADGIISVEKSMTEDTYIETTEGMRLLRGFASPLFINDAAKNECILNNAKVLVTDVPIDNLLRMEDLMQKVIKNRDPLLIIAPCSQNVVNVVAANKMKSGLKWCTITPPDFGFRQHDIMEDIAIATGATFFSQKVGEDLSVLTYDDLGDASKIMVGSKETNIVVGHMDEVNDRIKELTRAMGETKEKKEKAFLESRVASLKGAIGVVYVGGATDLEQKERYDRVEDSVLAVRSALEEGVLPGGGIPLLRLALEKKEKKDLSIAEEVLGVAMCLPFSQIIENGDKDCVRFIANVLNDGKPYTYGYNAKTGEWGDMIEMGIVDPAKVTKTALTNAVAVASTILSTDCIITMERA